MSRRPCLRRTAAHQSSTLLRPQVAPYQPPAINSFSDRVIGYNESFTFNAGVGNNPTNRDAYVRLLRKLTRSIYCDHAEHVSVR